MTECTLLSALFFGRRRALKADRERTRTRLNCRIHLGFQGQNLSKGSEMKKNRKSRQASGNRAPINPLAIFGSAERFLHSHILLSSAMALSTEYIFPCAVVEAFAVELYFKCLLHLCGKPGVRGHKLKVDLFDELDKSTKTKLADYYNSAKGKSIGLSAAAFVSGATDYELETVLTRANDAFALLRYWHENPGAAMPVVNGVGGNAGLQEVMHALRQIIVELRPDWIPTIKRPILITYPNFQGHRSHRSSA
jgi:hypothetical protein